MLRLAEPLLIDRIGGWSPIESPPQRTATTSQQWSVAIAVVAAMVSLLAIFLDLRLPSGSSSPVVLAIPSSTTTEVAAVGVASGSQAGAEVAPPTVVGTSSRVVADSRAGSSVSSSVGSTESASTVGSSSSSTEAVGTDPVAESTASSRVSAASETVEAVEGAAGTGNAAAIAAAEPIDPTARLREYLGLHEGAPLPVSFTYIVEAGDTASSIAGRFGLNEATVLFNNFDIYDPSQLTIGQQLTLPTVDGLVYTIQPGDTFSALMSNFQGDAEATLAYASNGMSSADQIYVGQTLVLVHGSASVVSSSPSGSGEGGQSATVWTVPTFIWPLGFDEISDYFGTARANSVGYHTGVDFVAAVGTIVGSTAAGQVTVATWDPSYGNWVEIDHGGGYRSRYAHLNEIFVREGAWVDSNAYIGTVGNTGNSSGAHLHFEIIIGGQAVNPLAWLN